MKTLIDTRIYALLSHNESNLLELTQAYKEFIEIMTEMIANCNDRDEILRILHYGRIEFDVLSHPMFNQYADNVLRTTFIYKVMYILDCEINIVSNSMKYTSEHDYSLPISCQGEMNYYGLERSRNCWSLLLPFIKAGLSCSVTERLALSKLFVRWPIYSI